MEIDLHLYYDNDNTSAIKLAKNPVFHARLKHIELHHHFIHKQILQREIVVSYLKTESQPEDILTKALSRPLFKKNRSALGMYSLKTFKSNNM